MNTNTNTSAFPWMVDDGEKVTGNKGMTLRDYFAAKAMHGLVSDTELSIGCTQVAELSYRYADAMLEARGK
jgi:hypothetical protein